MLDRLALRAAGALVLGALAGAALSAPPALADDVSIALDWTPNTNHVGIYVAEAMGYFRKAGLDVTVLPYSDTAPATLVSNGVADFGIGDIGFYTQRAAGGDVRAVFAVTQHETGRLIVKADRDDITRPRDLDGKTYGGFGTAWETALVKTIIRGDGGKGTFNSVVLGTSAYQALDSGAIDVTMDMSTWEGVQAKMEGEKVRAFSFADHGLPDEYTTVILSSDAWLDSHPDDARAFIQAVQKGYAYAADHPDKAADILIAAAPDMLGDHELVHASMHALVDGHFLRGEDGAVGDMDPARITAVGNFLVKAGLLSDENGNTITTAPDFSAYYTNDYLAPDGQE